MRRPCAAANGFLEWLLCFRVLFEPEEMWECYLFRPWGIQKMAVALKEDTFASYPDFGGFLFTLTKYTDHSENPLQ